MRTSAKALAFAKGSASLATTEKCFSEARPARTQETGFELRTGVVDCSKTGRSTFLGLGSTGEAESDVQVALLSEAVAVSLVISDISSQKGPSKGQQREANLAEASAVQALPPPEREVTTVTADSRETRGFRETGVTEKFFLTVTLILLSFYDQ